MRNDEAETGRVAVCLEKAIAVMVEFKRAVKDLSVDVMQTSGLYLASLTL
jgi:hypothetical protein